MMGADYQETNEGSLHSDLAIGVGDNSRITNAIIDKNARIGNGVALSPLGVSEGWADEKQNIYVRDGVLIVVKNANVEKGTVIGKF